MARRGKYGNACLVCDKGKAAGVRIICCTAAALRSAAKLKACYAGDR